MTKKTKITNEKIKTSNIYDDDDCEELNEYESSEKNIMTISIIFFGVAVIITSYYTYLSYILYTSI